MNTGRGRMPDQNVVWRLGDRMPLRPGLGSHGAPASAAVARRAGLNTIRTPNLCITARPHCSGGRSRKAAGGTAQEKGMQRLPPRLDDGEKNDQSRQSPPPAGRLSLRRLCKYGRTGAHAAFSSSAQLPRSMARSGGPGTMPRSGGPGTQLRCWRRAAASSFGGRRGAAGRRAAAGRPQGRP
jgi:hypothetical protein